MIYPADDIQLLWSPLFLDITNIEENSVAVQYL